MSPSVAASLSGGASGSARRPQGRPAASSSTGAAAQPQLRPSQAMGPPASPLRSASLVVRSDCDSASSPLHAAGLAPSGGDDTRIEADVSASTLSYSSASLVSSRGSSSSSRLPVSAAHSSADLGLSSGGPLVRTGSGDVAHADTGQHVDDLDAVLHDAQAALHEQQADAVSAVAASIVGDPSLAAAAQRARERAAASRACSDAVSTALRTRSARRAARVQEASWNSVNTRGRKRRAGLSLFEPGPPQQSPMRESRRRTRQRRQGGQRQQRQQPRQRQQRQRHQPRPDPPLQQRQQPRQQRRRQQHQPRPDPPPPPPRQAVSRSPPGGQLSLSFSFGGHR